jgi:predicted hotdog family 3-hydroxylacyl-ACP dehydratase
MTLPETLPPIEDLLHHRGTMRLLDRVIRFAADTVATEYTPRADAWYADGDGNLPGWFGIELMAQTVAVHVAMSKRLHGLPAKMGALLGTRMYRANAASFASGRALEIHAREVFRDQSGLAGYECAITRDGEPLAEAILKVFEPEDFGLFMQGKQ